MAIKHPMLPLLIINDIKTILLPLNENNHYCTKLLNYQSSIANTGLYSIHVVEMEKNGDFRSHYLPITLPIQGLRDIIIVRRSNIDFTQQGVVELTGQVKLKCVCA